MILGPSDTKVGDLCILIKAGFGPSHTLQLVVTPSGRKSLPHAAYRDELEHRELISESVCGYKLLGVASISKSFLDMMEVEEAAFLINA